MLRLASVESGALTCFSTRPGFMQKRSIDSLLYGTIALLAFSILGFIYLLWQTYGMATK